MITTMDAAINAVKATAWIACAGAALLAWPDETAKARMRSFMPAVSGGRVFVGSTGKAGSLLLVAVLVIVDVAVGIEASLAAVMVAWTGVRVMRGSRRRKALRNQAVEIMQATETICAELRAGAEPTRALLSAHRDLVGMGSVGAVNSVGAVGVVGAVGARAVVAMDLASAAGGQRVEPRGVVGGGAAGLANSGSRVAEEFERAVHRAAFGSPWAEYLREAEASNAIHPDLVRLARSWQSAQGRGLPMADIIDNCRSDIAARMAFRSRTAAALAGPRMTIMILASLPVIGLVLGQAFGASPLEFLSGGGLGGIVLVVGTMLSCAGVLWATHILGVAEAGT